METTTHRSIEEAIEAARTMQDARPFAIDTCFTVPEIHRTSDDVFTVFFPLTLSEAPPEGVGELLGYFDGGRFQPVEEVRAEVRRDAEMDARAGVAEAMLWDRPPAR